MFKKKDPDILVEIKDINKKLVGLGQILLEVSDRLVELTNKIDAMAVVEEVPVKEHKSTIAYVLDQLNLFDSRLESLEDKYHKLSNKVYNLEASDMKFGKL